MKIRKRNFLWTRGTEDGTTLLALLWSDITVEEVEEEKIKPPKMRTLSLRMNSKDIQKEELVKRLKKNDILETDYYFSTHDG